jgi:hypothetical protein
MTHIEEKHRPTNIIDIPTLNDYMTFEKNRAKADSMGEEHCPCCGKMLINPKYFINSIFGGCMYPASDKNEYSDAWVMGIGSECRKKLPDGYVYQMK